METPVSVPRQQTAAVSSDFVRQVYNWMAGGLALTAVVALFTASSPTLLQMVFGNRLVFFALIFGELGLVIALSGAIRRLSAAAATGLFLFYSALNGVTMASIFLLYTRASIAGTFFVAAATFAAMSLYGHLTKRDLTSWGSFLFMGLVGVVIASLVNLFLQSAMIYWVSTCCGVIVFVGLTAYDTQKIKALAWSGFSDGEAQRKGAILGALTLYLDFINLFLLLLRLFGRRR